MQRILLLALKILDVLPCIIAVWMFAGVEHNRSDLDAIPEGVQVAANSGCIWLKFMWPFLGSPILIMKFGD
jgi:hypothetical protein